MLITVPYRIPETNRSATACVLLLTAYTLSSNSLKCSTQMCSVLRFSTLSFTILRIFYWGLPFVYVFKSFYFSIIIDVNLFLISI